MATTGKENEGSWTLTDAFWAKVEPLVPARKVDPKGRGRPPVPDRTVFAGILYVLRTGCQWKAVPRQFGTGSTVHLRFQQWERGGLFLSMWQAGLVEYDEMCGIAWSWQSIDGAMTKAPLGGDATGRNPTDRGKKGNETAHVGGRPWRPVVVRRQRGERVRL
jgi:transposase